MACSARRRGLEDVSKFPNLTRALLEKGYSAEDIRKIYGGNTLRVMRAVEAEARREQLRLENRLTEFVHRRGLIGAHGPDRDLRDVIIFRAHRRTRQPPQHRDLSDMRKRIGDGRLKQLLGRRVKRAVRSQIVIQRLQRGKEAVHFLGPGKRRRIVPLLLAARS